MITAGDFRKGVTIEWEGGVWTIVDFQHVKPGKGAAFVRTKLKNVMTGAVVERSFNPTDKEPRATIETKEMQYVYNDGEFYYFMDQETFEQIQLTHDQVEDAIQFMKEERDEGKAILYSTHYMEEAQYLCDRIVLLYQGKIIDSGTPESLMEKYNSNNLRDTFKACITNS